MDSGSATRKFWNNWRREMCVFRWLVIICAVAADANAQTVPPPVTHPSNPDAVMLRLAQGPEWAPLPAEFVSGEIIVQGMIDGRPATVLLDNGTSKTALDTGFAERAQIKLVRPGGGAIVGLAKISSRQTAAVTFEVPHTLTIRGPMVAFDLTPMSKALGRRIDAILGGDVLNRLAVMIRPDKRNVSIVSSGGITIDDPNTIVLPVVEGDQIEASLEGKAVRLKIDLGYTGAIRLSDTAWSRIFPAGTPATGSTRTTADGVLRTTRTAKAALQIGRLSARDAPIDSGYAPVDSADGLLGTGFFLQGISILDLPKKQVMLVLRGKATGS